MSFLRRCFKKWIWTIFRGKKKKKASASPIKTYLQALSIANHEIELYSNCCDQRRRGHEYINPLLFISVSKTKSGAIIDLAVADRVEDLTASLTWVHWGSSHLFPVCSIGENVTHRSACLNTYVPFTEREMCYVWRTRFSPIVSLGWQMFYSCTCYRNGF